MMRRKRWRPDSVGVLIAKAAIFKGVTWFVLDCFLAKTSILIPFRRSGKRPV
jgi:hypothetical protein